MTSMVRPRDRICKKDFWGHTYKCAIVLPPLRSDLRHLYHDGGDLPMSHPILSESLHSLGHTFVGKKHDKRLDSLDPDDVS